VKINKIPFFVQRIWPAKDFLDRWFLQSNYPSLFVQLKYDSVQQKQYLQVQQERYANSQEDIFGLEDLYPTPYK
jgi:hypothetical protein